MNRTRVLLDAERMFELTRDEFGHHFLTVVCGGIGLYEVTIPMTADETRLYAEWGRRYLEGLAYRISRNEGGIQERSRNIST